MCSRQAAPPPSSLPAKDFQFVRAWGGIFSLPSIAQVIEARAVVPKNLAPRQIGNAVNFKKCVERLDSKRGKSAFSFLGAMKVEIRFIMHGEIHHAMDLGPSRNESS
jgi:hypothetical protein